ncbi:MAG: paraquat-inducible protein A [Bacteroidota bacterium]
MSIRNIIALILIIISLVCLYPGLMTPIISLKIGANLPLVGELVVHETVQSIVDTIKTLHENDNTLVAGLILLFSVIVPILKAVILLLVLFAKKMGLRKQLHKFVAIISKWSMADVFVVGVLLATLATSSEDSIEAKLHSGFYYFVGYCLISILASQIMQVEE